MAPTRATRGSLLLALDPRQHRLHYDIVSNATLWFLHHGLFDLPRRPRFDERFREAWDAYVAVNRAFADRVVETASNGDIVLVQDYHLALVPGDLRKRRPDLRVVHFTHTPFCGPNSIRVLPDDVGRAICESMATVPCGFHSRRWARAYEAWGAYAYGRAALSIKTIKQWLGIDINHVVEINFERFPDLVDAMGGIDYTGGCVVSKINGSSRTTFFSSARPHGASGSSS